MAEAAAVTTTLEAGEDVLLTLVLGPERDDEGLGCRVVDLVSEEESKAGGGVGVGHCLVSLNGQDVRDLDFVHILQFLKERGGLPRPVEAAWGVGDVFC